eukprot:6205598-Pleurochrysis_carterae.AAC.1
MNVVKLKSKVAVIVGPNLVKAQKAHQILLLRDQALEPGRGAGAATTVPGDGGGGRAHVHNERQGRGRRRGLRVCSGRAGRGVASVGVVAS